MSTSESAKFKQQWRDRVTAMAHLPAPTIEQQRAAFDAEHGAVAMPEGCQLDMIEAGHVRGERITPPDVDPSKAILYHHGGGHIFGSALSHRHLVARLAETAGATAFNMNYALAPESPFPAGLEDAVRAWNYVRSLGFKPQDIVVAGESAGGNLTAALLLKLRELGEPMPAAAYLLSPWVDLEQRGASYAACAERDPMVTREALRGMADMYCAGTSPSNPLVSPLNADLGGLPPLFIQVGGDEVLLSDSTCLADRAALAGVEVTLRVWPGMVHAWPLFHHVLPLAGLSAIAEAGCWIRKQLGAAPGTLDVFLE